MQLSDVISLIIGLVFIIIISKFGKRVPWLHLIAAFALFYFAYGYFFLLGKKLEAVFFLIGGIGFLYSFITTRHTLNIIKTNILSLINKKKEDYLTIEDKKRLMEIANIDDEEEFDSYFEALLKRGDIPFIEFKDDENDGLNRTRFAEFDMKKE